MLSVNKSINLKEEVMFFSPVYSCFLDNIDNDKIIKESHDFKKIFSSNDRSNYGGWHSPTEWKNKDIENKEIKNLLDTIHKVVHEVSVTWELSELRLSNFWININQKYNFNKSHNHPNSVFSGCYYVKCNQESGRIIFERPDNQEFCISSSSTNKYRFSSYWFSPTPSQLLIFPSNLKHFVEPNMSEEDRISIAFNFEK